jgi:hypothetical protein
MSSKQARPLILTLPPDCRPKRAPVSVPAAGRRRYWKTTLRSASQLGFILLGEWHEEIRIFRWKWLAKMAARRHRIRAPRGTLIETIVEPYRPGENIVALGALRSSEFRPDH